MRKLLASLAITMGAVGTAHAQADLQADADAAAGRELAQTCAACHGQQGISAVGTFPNLAGQQMSYLAKQIMDIRDGNRVVPQMAGLVDDYSDQDAWDVAAHFAGQDANLGQTSDKMLSCWPAVKSFTAQAICPKAFPPVALATLPPG